MFSGGLSLFLRSQQRRTVIVEELVTRRTAELATTQQALAASEERYRAFIGQSAEPIWRCENRRPLPLDLGVEAQIAHLFAHAYVAECNDAMARAYGYTRAAEIVGTSLSTLLDPKDPSNQAFLRAFLTAPGYQLTDIETRETDRHGQPKIFLNSLVGIVEGGQLVRAWGTQRDITARRQAELALAESRRLLDSMMDQLPGMSVRCTAGPGYPAIYISRGVERLTGYVAEDFLSGRILYSDLIHPEDLPGVWPAILAGTEARRPFQIQYRIRDRAGVEHWVLEVGHGLYHADGHLEFIDSLSIDCTAQKQAEAAKLTLERQLADGQRLESLGVLAGGVAHDFNNLLTAILGHASLARLQAPSDANVESLQQIELASRRAADLCQQMLAYAGKGKLTTAPVDLGELVRGTVSLLEVSIGKNIRLALRLAPVIPSVLGDATQLRQIVMNLVLNAADAIGAAPGGCIEIFGTGETVDAARFAAAIGAPALPGGDYAVIELRDNGCGMTPAVLARIFEPFYTTKFTGRGLGLSAVLGIVQGHRGALFVTSTAGQGTCFRLFLPTVAPVDSAPLAPPPAAANPSLTGRAILVVDDEPSVRQIATSILQRAGAVVHTAPSGDDALVWVRDTRPALDLVLLDLTMPGLTGEETLAQLHTLRPDLPVILMSGYSESGILGRLGQQGAVDFLQKPFELDALLGCIRATLDRRT
jgi:PAS domain S-box-containing protein